LRFLPENGCFPAINIYRTIPELHESNLSVAFGGSSKKNSGGQNGIVPYLFSELIPVFSFIFFARPKSPIRSQNPLPFDFFLRNRFPVLISR
jgi:hypothetical protein